MVNCISFRECRLRTWHINLPLKIVRSFWIIGKRIDKLKCLMINFAFFVDIGVECQIIIYFFLLLLENLFLLFFPFLFRSFGTQVDGVNYFLCTLSPYHFLWFQPQTFSISVILSSIEYVLIFESNSILTLCIIAFSVYGNRKRPDIFHWWLFVHVSLQISVIVFSQNFLIVLLIIYFTCFWGWS